jgi:hypothetical protein
MTIRRFLRFAAGAALVLAAWLLIMLAMPFVGRPGRQVAVIARPDTVVAAGGQLIDVRGEVVLARSDRADFAASLYRHGATLVLEGRLASGCLRLRSA